MAGSGSPAQLQSLVMHQTRIVNLGTDGTRQSWLTSSLQHVSALHQTGDRLGSMQQF